MTSPASPTTATPEPADTATPTTPTGGAPTMTPPPASPHVRAAQPPRADDPTPGAAHGPGDRQGGRRPGASLPRRARRRAQGGQPHGCRHRAARTLLGQLVWFACLLAATALLLGAVLVVLEANTRNALVEAVLRAADWADLGVFSRTAGVKQFTGDGAAVKNALTNWGLGAVAWLVVGRLARRILTP